MTIRELSISARSKSCLISAGYKDVEDLCDVSDDMFLSIKNLNQACVTEIRDALNEYSKRNNLDEKEWLEDAKKILDEEERFEAEKQTRLYIKSIDDLPENYAGIKKITISINYSGPPVESILPIILKNAYDVDSLDVFGSGLKWETLCSLDLSHIQDCWISLDGEITFEKLSAPDMKKLSIMGTSNLTPIELMLHPVPHIDFSEMPVLEELELRHFQQVDPVDFQNVRTLKKLLISDMDITDMDWLKNATYSLESLFLDGPIENCEGVVCQQNLKRLQLYHSYLSDVTPIESLKHLKMLDLRYGEIANEGHLRSMNIEEMAITREDGDYLRIKQQVKELVRQAVKRYRSQNRQVDKLDEKSVFFKKLLLQRMSEPFEVRIQHLIQFEFEQELRAIDRQDKIIGCSISKEDYRNAFIKDTLRYYPFVKCS